MEQRGFTLLETLFAAALLGTATLGFLGATAQALRVRVSAGETSRVTSVAQATMESLVRRPFDQTVAGGALDRAVTDYSTVRTFDSGPAIEVRWQVVDRYGGDLKELRVRAVSRATLAVNGPREASLVTFVSAAKDPAP